MIKLEKNSKISLKKEDASLKVVQVGLGWDTKTDLDSIAYLYDEAGKIKNTVYFGAKKFTGIFLNGDNLTGEGDGDDEIITVTLEQLPKWVTKVSFCANIFAAKVKLWGVKDFSKVKGAFIRIVNAESNKEICRYDLHEDGKGFNAFYFADLVRTDGDWEFVAVGKGINGSIDAIKEQLQK